MIAKFGAGSVTLRGQLSSPPDLSAVCVTGSLVLWVMLCRSLFVHLSFFIWSLHCLFFDLRLLVTSFYWSACAKQGKWAAMHLCVKGVEFASFLCDFDVWFCNCFDSVVYFVFHFVFSDDNIAYHNNMKFLTIDVDNVLYDNELCAANVKLGGLWYNDCADANLNGLYGSVSVHNGI